MEYTITCDTSSVCYRIDTNFDIDFELQRQISECDGVVPPHGMCERYSFDFKIGQLFVPSEVKQSVENVLNTYIKKESKALTPPQ